MLFRSATSVWVALVYMAVLGLGLGLVMQVLVLAAQNAVDYRNLGVATSATTLFRSIGGSIGVSLFGATFSGGLAANLHQIFLAGTNLPSATAPAALQSLSTTTRSLYLEAFTAALHSVFLRAAIITAFGFALTWLLREVPLRGRAPISASRPYPANHASDEDIVLRR